MKKYIEIKHEMVLVDGKRKWANPRPTGHEKTLDEHHAASINQQGEVSGVFLVEQGEWEAQQEQAGKAHADHMASISGQPYEPAIAIVETGGVPMAETSEGKLVEMDGIPAVGEQLNSGYGSSPATAGPETPSENQNG